MIEYKPTKKIAPQWLGIAGAVIAIGILIASIALFLNLIIWKNTKAVIICLLIDVILLTINFILSKMFAWVEKTTLETDSNGDLLFRIYDIIEAFGSNVSTYRISEISDVICKKHTITIKGNIVIKEPLQKPKNATTIKINDYNEEMLTMFKEACNG